MLISQVKEVGQQMTPPYNNCNFQGFFVFPDVMIKF